MGISANTCATGAKANAVPEIILAILAQVIDAAGTRACPLKPETMSRCQRAHQDQGSKFIPHGFGTFARRNDAKANIKGGKGKLSKNAETGKLEVLNRLLW